eukprot:GHVR01156784.1.p1 GENE.GHVR01156784.1~~GHVR01156784.1.p1  ORF type:complete len:414 (-),score=94.94 GHVR01156784.1:160-1401(-)
MNKMLFLLFVCITTKAYALYSQGGPVIRLNASNFESTITKSDESWVVEFYAEWCGHCKALAPEYEKAAKALKGVVKLAAVDDESLMGQYGVKGFPTLKFFSADNKKNPSDYQGERTAKGIIDFATKEVTNIAKARLSGKSSKGGSKGEKSEVITLTDSNFDKLVYADKKAVWFIKFYAPWCGHCKSLAPIWESSGKILKGKVMMGKVDVTVEKVLGSRFGIQSFPTLKLFPSGEKNDGAAIDYSEGRTEGDIVHFANQYADIAREADQLTNETQFTDNCERSLCVIAFLPHLLDSGVSGRNQYLKDFNGGFKAAGNVPVKFLWSQGGDQFELEDQLGMAFGYPALIAVNLEKGFGIHRGDFSQTSIRAFLTQMMSGGVPISPVPKNRKQIVTVKEWDGKDAPPPSDVDEKDEL